MKNSHHEWCFFGSLFLSTIFLVEYGCNQSKSNQSSHSSPKPTGTLMAHEEVELRPEMSGRVTGVFFEEGARVSKGELMLKINDSELRAELKRKEIEEKLATDE